MSLAMESWDCEVGYVKRVSQSQCFCVIFLTWPRDLKVKTHSKHC